MTGKTLLALAGGACLLAAAAQAQTIRGREGITLPQPPLAAVKPVTDNYFGQKIVDNYRWLEDAKSPETRAFIDAQNTYTERYFKQVRIRESLAEELAPLLNITSVGLPIERQGNYFFLKRLAGEQQASIYMRRGWTGKDERLVDPAALSRDTNTSVSIADIARDGRLLAYRLRQGGADEASIRLLDLGTGKTLEDQLPTARYQDVFFAPDGKSLYYARNDKQGSLLYRHQLGTLVAHDTLLFGREFRGEALTQSDLFDASISDDGRYLILAIERGVPARRVDIVFRDLTKGNPPFEVLVWGLDARFETQWVQGAWLVKTDYNAPNGRILKADPGIMPEAWSTVIPEAKDPIEEWSVVGGKLFVSRLHDVQTQISINSLAGKALGSLPQEGIGSGSTLYGRSTDRYGFFSFSSLIVPPSIYRYDTATGKRELFFQPKVPFDSAQYELHQEFYTSKDGTRVPIFIAGPKNAPRDGSARLLMTGYGGFDLSELPAWNPQAAWWMAHGGWFALPNLRGGGEYGESWHQQGQFEHKQNVFDDWFAAAEYLIAHKYTAPARLAIRGRSNGGLLMGASITQRPELFGAIWCGYPLLDMLRYQHFLVGSYWVTEYGSSEKAEQLPYLLNYSPYHNVRPSVAYPAILFFTGDNDTRVAPLHARKMTALMQATSTSQRPILLHYSLSGGHSAGVGIQQLIEDYADELSFLWTETSDQKAVR